MRSLIAALLLATTPSLAAPCDNVRVTGPIGGGLSDLPTPGGMPVAEREYRMPLSCAMQPGGMHFPCRGITTVQAVPGIVRFRSDRWLVVSVTLRFQDGTWPAMVYVRPDHVACR